MASKIRQELEDHRDFMKEKLQRIRFDLTKFTDQKSSEYQWKASEKRKLIRDMNLLTAEIKKIQEMDSDPEICKQLDDQYEELRTQMNLPDKPKSNIKKSEFDKGDDDVDDDIKGMVDDFLNGL